LVPEAIVQVQQVVIVILLILLLLLAMAVLLPVIMISMALEQTLRVTAVVKAVQEPATVIILFHLVAVVPADTQATVATVVADKIIVVVELLVMQVIHQKLVPVAVVAVVLRDPVVV
jgi:hypothetical protein